MNLLNSVLLEYEYMNPAREILVEVVEGSVVLYKKLEQVIKAQNAYKGQVERINKRKG